MLELRKKHNTTRQIRTHAQRALLLVLIFFLTLSTDSDVADDSALEWFIHARRLAKVTTSG